MKIITAPAHWASALINNDRSGLDHRERFLTITLWSVNMKIIMIAFIAFVVWAANEDDNKWQTFKAAHNCKIVSQSSGDTFNTYGINSDGSILLGAGSSSPKTGYLCNDGVTYYR